MKKIFLAAVFAMALLQAQSAVAGFEKSVLKHLENGDFHYIIERCGGLSLSVFSSASERKKYLQICNECSISIFPRQSRYTSKTAISLQMQPVIQLQNRYAHSQKPT
jgi:hypothetical protein